MKLITGTDSTWSLRVWICAQIAGLDLEIKAIDLSSLNYKSEVLKYSQAGLVPVLLLEDTYIHDSLAIAEYFNELSKGILYPSSNTERAQSRSLCAELHSGFIALRSNCPFTLDKSNSSPDINSGIQTELKRIEDIFSKAKLPFMFDSAGAVDAFYAILAYRLYVYNISLSEKATKYQQSLLEWPILQQAIDLAAEWRNS
ncbi:glutathione S-transferase N-terminal domain-containing protein [Microbulbifer sp. EKSA008]|uniref:glutathione S-transferase N-terminal domain-containing protein n=1 Tax=Microbulbifer sp. EKSA008 TaxID=3243367 RepID=UPI004040F050